MRVEIDQSGKFEATKEDTVLALSNGVEMSVLVSRSVKRSCIQELRSRGHAGQKFYTQLFATGLFFLLRNYSDNLSQVIIDTEYTGKERQIKEHLINLLRRAHCRIIPEAIQFRQIGKKIISSFFGFGNLARK